MQERHAQVLVINKERGQKFYYLLFGLKEEQVEVGIGKTAHLTWTLALSYNRFTVDNNQ